MLQITLMTGRHLRLLFQKKFRDFCLVTRTAVVRLSVCLIENAGQYFSYVQTELNAEVAIDERIDGRRGAAEELCNRCEDVNECVLRRKERNELDDVEREPKEREDGCHGDEHAHDSRLPALHVAVSLRHVTSA